MRSSTCLFHNAFQAIAGAQLDLPCMEMAVSGTTNHQSGNHSLVRYFQICPYGWTQHGARCFLFVNSGKNWDSAEVQKQGHVIWRWTDGSWYNYNRWYPGEPNNWFGREECMEINFRAWIGLYRDSWKWVDGTKPSITNWRTGEPSGLRENCAAASMEDGKWEDWDCTVSMTFFSCFILK
uniref:C-type lectin domain-containing protein n=1 Tax=Nothobranchius furzeri TaxID=105023 RepID=A0A8C6PZR5_NOTFU